ncbi:MAG: hypothetical protein H0T79_15315 [Deltaproteobacteria bacterium]|nr:hypothetical protein [Deltaproteobacteria bacterium]
MESKTESEPDEPDPIVAPTGMSTKRKAAIAAGGAGVVAVAIGLGFGLKARSHWSDAHADGHCDDQEVCDDVGFASIDDAYSAARVSTVVTSLGIAALGAGAILWLTGGESAESSRTSFAPAVRPDHVGVVMQGRF